MRSVRVDTASFPISWGDQVDQGRFFQKLALIKMNSAGFNGILA